MRQRKVNRACRFAWLGASALFLASGAVLAQGPSMPPAKPGAGSSLEQRGLGSGAPSTTRKPSTSGVDRAESSPGVGGGFVRTSLALGGVLALAVISTAAIKAIARNGKFGLGMASRSPAGVMEVLGRYPIGRGATLVLLKLDRRILLLSQSAGGKLGLTSGVTTLCEVTDPDEIASILLKARDAEGDSLAERFRGLLSRFDRNMDAAGEDPQQPRRRVTGSAAGDRAELWRETAEPIQVVDLTKRPGEPDANGAVGSLRRRLAAIRWPQADGGERA